MPSAKPPIIRRRTARAASFDDQAWPVHCALLALAGLVAAVVFVTSDFGEPRLLYNGWVRLAGVGLLVAALLAAVRWLERRMLRRVQFCILVSLLAHFWIAVFLHQKHLAMVAAREAQANREAVTAEDVRRMPDYHWTDAPTQSLRSDYERPVETPTLRDSQARQAARQTDERDVPISPRQAAAVETPAWQQPDAAELRRAEPSAPRREPQAAGGQVSRQEWQQRPRPDAPIPQPQPIAVGAERAPTLRPTAVEPTRQLAKAQTPERRTFDAPAADRPQERPAIGRKTSQPTPSSETPATPTPTKRLADAGAPSPAEAALPRPTKTAAEPRPVALQPAAQAVAQQPAKPPRGAQPAVEPAPTAATLPARQAITARAIEPRPELAQAAQAVPARQPRPTALPVDAAEAPSQPAAAPSLPQRLASMVGAVARQSPDVKGTVPFSRAAPAATASDVASAKGTGQFSPRENRDSPQRQPRRAEDAPATSTVAAGGNVPRSERPSAAVAMAADLPATPAMPSPSAAADPTTKQLAAAGGAVARQTAAAAQTARATAEPGDPAPSGAANLPAAAVRRVEAAQTASNDATVAPAGGPQGVVRSSRGLGLPAAIPVEGEVAPAPASSGEMPTPAVDVQVAAPARAGRAVLPTERPSPSAGDERPGGSSAPVGLAQPARAGAPQPQAAVVSAGAPAAARTAPALAVPVEALAAAPIAPGETPSATGSGPSGEGRLEASVVGQARQSAALPGGPAIATAAAPTAASSAITPAVSGRDRAGGEPAPAVPGVAALARVDRAARTAILAGEADLAAEVSGGPAMAGPAAPSASGHGPVAMAPAADAPVARGGGPGVAAARPGAILAAGSPESPDSPQAAAGAPLGEAAPSRNGHNGLMLTSVEVSEPAGAPRRASRAALADVAFGVPDAPAAEPTSGQPAADPAGAAEAALTGPARQQADLAAVATQRRPATGAAAAEPSADLPAAMAGPRRLPHGPDTGPTLAAEVGGGPLRRTTAPGLPRGLAAEVEQQTAATGSTDATSGAAPLAAGERMAAISRREGGLPVQIAAAPGPGGLSLDPSPTVGIPSRRARPESEVVHTVARRFVMDRSGGELAIDGAVHDPAEIYQQRDPGRRAQAARVRGGSEGTERAVESGLDFFARVQFPDGRWSIHKLPPEVRGDDAALGQMESDTAATGLVLLAYLGAGYTHLDDKHRAVVDRGLQWLARNQKPDGDLFTGGTRYAWFYSHGMASIALCEAFGMTQDPQLREPARKAVQFIVQSQEPNLGGWRYAPGKESDVSVSGWQVQALKSAQIAGIEVPAETLRRTDRFLDRAQAPGGRYVYNPLADRNRPEQADGLRPSLAMTAEGMLMRMYLGRSRGDAVLAEGGQYLAAHPPENGPADRPLRDCYYWYYATQAMFQLQGDAWRRWNERMRAALEPSQEPDGAWAGSWHPERPVRDRWGHSGGRLYVTAMHLLMLEVYYRHLPLYQELTK